MKLFITSDEHGHFEETFEAEKENSYDRDNPNHFRISLGDFHDRGANSLELYKYYKELTSKNKMIVLKSNHTELLIDILTHKDQKGFNYSRNGLKETLESFIGEKNAFVNYIIHNHLTPDEDSFNSWLYETVERINKENPELLPWLEALPDYFETEKYIFVHASIDTECQDWREPNIPWQKLHWDDGSFFGKELINTEKTVVFGHFGTSRLRQMYGIIQTPEESTYLPLRAIRERKIAIDSTVVKSKKINLIVLEDDFIKGD